MSQVRYSPFRAINGIKKDLDQNVFYRQAAIPSTKAKDATSNWIPLVDIQESEKAFHVTVELPGVKDNEIDITLDKNILTIKGDRLISSTEGFDYTRQERASGSFVRQFTLPESVDGENIKAKSNLGVLNITIPKADLPKPLSIAVEGSL